MPFGLISCKVIFFVNFLESFPAFAGQAAAPLHEHGRRLHLWPNCRYCFHANFIVRYILINFALSGKVKTGSSIEIVASCNDAQTRPVQDHVSSLNATAIAYAAALFVLLQVYNSLEIQVGPKLLTIFSTQNRFHLVNNGIIHTLLYNRTVHKNTTIRENNNTHT